MSLQQQYPPWLTPNPVQEKDPFCHVATPVHPYDKEPMFEKPLTPSDVGKLNRLVIPKLQAEKYFPLGGGGSAAASAGTLLGFEDEDGKEWRFRYSYWTSSQSYVLTKGWSRFVKDKRLLTGDVVCFERHRGNPARMFIGWRRPSASAHHPPPTLYNPAFCYNNNGPSTTSFLPFHHLYDDSLHTPPVAAEEVTGGGSSNSRRQVRLFGVNLDLECQLDNLPSSQTTSSSEASSLFSTTQQQPQSYHQHYYFDSNNYYYNPPPQHM